MKHIRFYFNSFFYGFFLLYGYSFSLLAEESRVVILSNNNNSAHQQVVSEFKTSLAQKLPDTKILSDTGVNASPTPKLVLALGRKALDLAKLRFPQTPLLACLAWDNNFFKHNTNTTGIVLQHTIKQQFKWHKRILPHIKRIGILYSPKHNKDWVKRAKTEAKRQGLKLIAIAVNSGQELPASLNAIKRQAGSIMAITDPVVYSRKTAKAVLLFSFRNRLPFIGLSETWAKSGALYALDWDYAALGTQCAKMAGRILTGTKIQQVAPQKPDNSLYIINMKTVKHMKLSIKQKYIDNAARIFK